MSANEEAADAAVAAIPSRPLDALDQAIAAVKRREPAGGKHLCELLHNNQPNKLEALDRGVLAALTEALDCSPDCLQSSIHVAAAIRSLSFRNDEARAAAREAGAIRAMVAACRDVSTLLQGALGSSSEVQHNPWLAMALLEECLTALVAITHRHTDNVAAAVAEGVRAQITTLQATLAGLSWPPVGPAADAHRAAAAGVMGEAAVAQVSPQGIAQKATMLDVCLG